MLSYTFVQALEERLAAEHRRVVSIWRATLLLRRATKEIPRLKRRWEQAPTAEETAALLRRLADSGRIVLIEGLHRIYRVTSPYAAQEPVLEEEILMELHPYAALSHHTALVFHGLTHDEPQAIYMLAPTETPADALPIGTTAEDWEGLSIAQGQVVKQLRGHTIHWYRPKPERVVGLAEYRPHKYPVRVTTPERTLLDGLERPDACGGMATVLRAWRLHRDLLDVDVMVQLVDALGIGVLRQRAGFVLERLGLKHPALETWAAQGTRGGSSRLSAQEPYAPVFSERWKLSLNTPLEALEEDAT